MTLSKFTKEFFHLEVRKTFFSSVCFCFIALLFVEPLQSMASVSSDDTIVTLVVDSTISNNCTSSVSMGTITGNGDTDSGGFNNSHATTCTIIANNSTGYSFGWLIQTGTGAAGSRSGTGHLNGFKTTANRIRALKPASTNVPEVFSAATVGANDARWAARLSSTSTTPGGGSPSWGTDGASDKWLNVATGSTVEVANRTSQTDASGDTEKVGFRTVIGSSYIAPTDTYKVIVLFTATTNP